jgi:hypothetical protein
MAFNFVFRTKNFKWKKDKGNTNGVGPSSTKIVKEEPKDLRRGENSPKREVVSKINTLEQIPKQVKYVFQEVSF